MGKMFLLVIIIIITLAVLFILGINAFDHAHKSIAERKLRKLNELTQEMEDRLQ